MSNPWRFRQIFMAFLQNLNLKVFADLLKKCSLAQTGFKFRHVECFSSCLTRQGSNFYHSHCMWVMQWAISNNPILCLFLIWSKYLSKHIVLIRNKRNLWIHKKRPPQDYLEGVCNQASFLMNCYFIFSISTSSLEYFHIFCWETRFWWILRHLSSLLLNCRK